MCYNLTNIFEDTLNLSRISLETEHFWHGTALYHMERVKRIWYLLPMQAVKVQASLCIRAVSPEPPLLAHTSSESRGTFRQKARSLAPLNGWACAVKMTECSKTQIHLTGLILANLLTQVVYSLYESQLFHDYAVHLACSDNPSPSTAMEAWRRGLLFPCPPDWVPVLQASYPPLHPPMLWFAQKLDASIPNRPSNQKHPCICRQGDCVWVQRAGLQAVLFPW